MAAASIKFVRQYDFYNANNKVYDVIYASGRVCMYSAERLPASVKRFIEGKTGRSQYDKLFKRDEIIYD